MMLMVFKSLTKWVVWYVYIYVCVYEFIYVYSFKFALIDRPREVVGSSRLERALKQTNISTSDPMSYAKILVWCDVAICV